MALHHKRSRKNIWASGFGLTGSGDKGRSSEYTSPEVISDKKFIDMLLGAAAIAREINRLELEATTSEESEETTEES